MYVLYSTLLHLPPLRFHCVGECWDRTQESCDLGIFKIEHRQEGIFLWRTHEQRQEEKTYHCTNVQRN